MNLGDRTLGPGTSGGTARAIGILGIAAGAADAGWVATTTPFTTGADAAVAVGFALVALVAGSTLRRRRRLERPAEPAGRLWPWMGVIGMLVVLELVAYVAGNDGHRHAWPTLSSLYDAAAADRWAKGGFAGLWLALGWGLFRR
jgi:hypothetical protein